MKQVVICIFAVYFLLGFSLTVPAAEGTKSLSDKSVTGSVSDTAKKAKEETVKGYKETKDAIVRDAKTMKEEIPKVLKEAKDAVVQQSKEIKEGATKEFKEIRGGVTNSSANPKSINKSK